MTRQTGMKNHTMPSNMFLIMHEAETTTRRRVMCVHPNCACIFLAYLFFIMHEAETTAMRRVVCVHPNCVFYCLIMCSPYNICIYTQRGGGWCGCSQGAYIHLFSKKRLHFILYTYTLYIYTHTVWLDAYSPSHRTYTLYIYTHTVWLDAYSPSHRTYTL